MERSCNTCRYCDLPVDVLPCNKCKRCSSDSKVDEWAVRIEDITDPVEKIGAAAELQGLMLLAMMDMREKIDNLIEEVHQRNR